MRLEDLQPNAAVRGILPDSLVTVVTVQWFGSAALELTTYLRTLDPSDPVKYDFALFGLGVIEKYY